MPIDVDAAVKTLNRMTVTQLRQRYAEVFGEAARSFNKQHLVKRIAWRLQAMHEGDLSERARRRAHELANDADLRILPPATPANADNNGGTATSAFRVEADDRLDELASLRRADTACRVRLAARDTTTAAPAFRRFRVSPLRPSVPVSPCSLDPLLPRSLTPSIPCSLDPLLPRSLDPLLPRPLDAQNCTVYVRNRQRASAARRSLASPAGGLEAARRVQGKRRPSHERKNEHRTQKNRRGDAKTGDLN